MPGIIKHDPSALDELKWETKRARHLTHTHIVRIHDIVEDEMSAAIAMEAVEGGTLSKLRVEKADRVFSVGEISAWTGQLCEALDYAHNACRVVHRDLKPGNLMIDDRGWLKIADFSIARSIASNMSRVSGREMSSGTPAYMSPQQMMGMESAVTDDIYALGATIYELLTGRPPFYSGDIVAQVWNRVPPSMTDRRAELGIVADEIPPEWEATVAACLAKDAAQRPQTAGEVARRLGIVGFERHAFWPEGGRPGAESRQTAKTGPNPAAGRRRPGFRFPFYAVLAAAVALLGGAGYYLRIHASKQMQRKVVETQGEIAISPMRASIAAVGSVRLITGAFERDGDRLAANYEAKVAPFFFLNETGRFSISLPAKELRGLGAGEARSFTGEAVNHQGRKRLINGRAEPASPDQGDLTVKVSVNDDELVFKGAYRFAEK